MSEGRPEAIDVNGAADADSNQAIDLTGAEAVTEAGPGPSSTMERLRRFWHRVCVGGAAVIIAAEVLPVNEAMRYGAAGATQLATGNSLAAAVVFGASTLAIEGLAAESTGYLMGTQYGKRIFRRLHLKTEKVVKGRRMLWPVEAAVAYFGGSAVVMSAKQIENPDRPKRQIVRHGRLTAAWLSIVVAVQWGLTANSIDNPTFVTITAAVVTTIGAGAGVAVAQRWSRP